MNFRVPPNSRACGSAGNSDPRVGARVGRGAELLLSDGGMQRGSTRSSSHAQPARAGLCGCHVL